MLTTLLAWAGWLLLAASGALLWRQWRRVRQLSLDTSQAELSTLLETIPQIVWITLPDGSHVHFNRFWSDFTGRTPEESMGEGWRTAFHPEDIQLAGIAWQHALETGEPYEVEYRLRRYDGVYLWMLGRALPLRDAQGKIVKWFGTCTNIQDLKSTLDRLNEAQRVAQIGDWKYNHITQAIEWSAQVFDIFGRDPALGPPRNLEDNATLYLPESAALLAREVSFAIEHGEARKIELQALRPTGEVIPVLVVAVPHIDEHGRLMGLYGTVQNITERKRTEQTLLARAHQQVLVASLGRFALADPDLDDIFTEAGVALAEGLGVSFSRVLWREPNSELFVLKGGIGWRSEWQGYPIDPSVPGSHVAYVMAETEPVIIDDFSDDTRFKPSHFLAQHGIVSGIDMLIGKPGNALGILGAYAREAHQFSTDDVSFLQSIANTLNTAIERILANERLTHMAQHDALTGLPNRLLLTDRLNIALEHAARSGARLAVMYMDLDRFKNVNDVFGHACGDEVLREVAVRLKSCVRASDTVSRQGGDEFLIVLPDIDSDDDAARVAQKLLAAVLTPFQLDKTDVVLGGSIGIVCYPENGRDAQTLLRNADAALYVAKDHGRGCYQFYSEDMNARAAERLMLEGDLRRALERNEFYMVYQPQFDLPTGQIVGLEALIRWQHPQRGLVPPVHFIHIAEDSGLIGAIGAWAMQTACRQHAEWLAKGMVTGTVAVNVSALQFRQPDFVESVSAILHASGLSPEGLEVEVTESVVMRGLEEVRVKLDNLHALGVKIAIDDFGTGYSSLNYLKQFPLHRLKIDQSFTRGLPTDRESGAIVQAIVSLGHSLGLDVMAEGIETEAQQVYLRTLNCEGAQGYFYTQPMPAEECNTYLARYGAGLSASA